MTVEHSPAYESPKRRTTHSTYYVLSSKFQSNAVSECEEWPQQTLFDGASKRRGVHIFQVSISEGKIL